tara:strand:+ start:735 stop:1007 length:273 start_codon:yes stop_codon:yes gene_type:complete
MLLNGCYQSTAMIGPTLSFASSGSLYQAGLSFSANKAIEKETGLTAAGHMNEIVQKKNKEKKIEEKLLDLIVSNYNKTRKILLSQYIAVN